MKKLILIISVAVGVLLFGLCSAQNTNSDLQQPSFISAGQAAAPVLADKPASTLTLTTQKVSAPAPVVSAAPATPNVVENTSSAATPRHHRGRGHSHHYYRHHKHYHHSYYARRHHTRHHHRSNGSATQSVESPVTKPALLPAKPVVVPTVLASPPLTLAAPHVVPPTHKAVQVSSPVIHSRASKLALVPMAARPNDLMGMQSVKQSNGVIPANNSTSGARAQYLHPYVTASAGISFTTLGTGLYFPNATVNYIYEPTSKNKSLGVFGASIGDEIRFARGIKLQVGVGYYQPNSTRVSGNLTQGMPPDYINYRYHYTVASQQLMVESKLLFTVKQYYLPYIYLGLGESMNQAYQFSTTVPATVDSTPTFPGKTTNNFAWSLGFGLDVNLLQNLRAGVGYRYAYLGKVNLGGAQFTLPWLSTSYANRMKQSSWVTNTFLLQLTYVY